MFAGEIEYAVSYMYSVSLVDNRGIGEKLGQHSKSNLIASNSCDN